MTTVAENNVIHVMKQRSSIRKYQQGVDIPQETLNQILEAAATAPSAWNLQHWKFLIIQDPENKSRILPIAYNQQQVVDASAVIIVLGDTKANENAEIVYGETVRAGFMTEEVKNQIVSSIDSYYESNEHAGTHDAIRNAAFAAMQLMLAAKAHGIDSGPMGGYDAEALRKELNIPDRYIPVLMLTLGYAEQPAHQTNRFPVDQLVIRERF